MLFVSSSSSHTLEQVNDIMLIVFTQFYKILQNAVQKEKILWKPCTSLYVFIWY